MVYDFSGSDRDSYKNVLNLQDILYDLTLMKEKLHKQINFKPVMSLFPPTKDLHDSHLYISMILAFISVYKQWTFCKQHI